MSHVSSSTATNTTSVTGTTIALGPAPAPGSGSTGPRTPAGKLVTRDNAYRHGLYTDRLVVAAEDAVAFGRYRVRLVRDVDPRDEREVELFQRILAATWKLKRMEEGEPLVYENVEAYPHPAADGDVEQGWQEQDGQDGDARQKGYWAKRRRHVAVTTVTRFDELEGLHKHQLRLQAASDKAWRMLAEHRKWKRLERADASDDDDASTTGPRPRLADVLVAQWEREAKSARQRRWRHNRRNDASRRACRRDVDADAHGGAREETSAASRPTHASPVTSKPPRVLQPQAAAALGRAAGRGEPVTVGSTSSAAHLLGRDVPFVRNGVVRRRLDRARDAGAVAVVSPVIAMTEAELTPWPDPVVAPNGELVAPALLDYLREYRPDAPELQPPPPPAGGAPQSLERDAQGGQR